MVVSQNLMSAGREF